jgi:polar amino acid transport system substrate-binding protein
MFAWRSVLRYYHCACGTPPGVVIESYIQLGRSIPGKAGEEEMEFPPVQEPFPEPEEEQPTRRTGRIVLVAVIAIIAVVLVIGALILWLGGGSTAAPPPPPTEAPPPEACSVYKTTGIILAATSGDYPPFEYYGDDYRLTGFDVDLMRAIAEKMGKQVDIADMAFDGLGTALQIGQIDVAIAAISVTEQRSQQFLFSDVYLVSQAGVLAKNDSTFGELTTPAQLVDKRTGVQAASVYEGWIQSTLVEPG